MLFRQKLAFFVFGCVFVIVGQVVTGLVVPSATAQGGLQDAEFNEVTVRKLTVVDEATGTVVARIFGDVDGGAVGVNLSDGTPSATMMALSSGGAVSVYQPDGTKAATMMALPDGGAVGINQPDGTETVHMAARPTGGVVRVRDTHGEPKAGIGVDKDGDGYVFP